MPMWIVIALMPTMLLAAGCGATLSAKRMHLPTTARPLSGMVVNQNVAHDVIAVFPKTPGGAEFRVERMSQMLPSPKEIYVVGYRGQLFSSRELTVDLNSDTSIKHVKVGSKAQTEAFFTDLTEAATQAAAIREAVKEPDPVDPTDEENAKLAKDLCTRMLTVNAADAAAGKALTYPTVTSCK